VCQHAEAGEEGNEGTDKRRRGGPHERLGPAWHRARCSADLRQSQKRCHAASDIGKRRCCGRGRPSHWRWFIGRSASRDFHAGNGALRRRAWSSAFTRFFVAGRLEAELRTRQNGNWWGASGRAVAVRARVDSVSAKVDSCASKRGMFLGQCFPPCASARSRLNLPLLERKLGLCGDATRAPPPVRYTAGRAVAWRGGPAWPSPCRHRPQSEKSTSPFPILTLWP
jgi:hypothetical protein